MEEKKPFVSYKDVNQKATFALVITALGIVGVELKDNRWQGYCPLHDGTKRDKKRFVADEEKKTFFCGGCNEKGSILDFAAKYQKQGLQGAAQWLQELLAKPEPSTRDRLVGVESCLAECLGKVKALLSSLQ